MENTQIAKLTNEMTTAQLLQPDLTGDYLWKSFYSHSYTLVFNCETCGHQFDIDGWFYQFDSLECPQCKNVFTGVFGKILSGSRLSHEISQKSVLKLEVFDGQEIDIKVSSSASDLKTMQDHIVLVIFSKSNDKSSRPWCLVDWSVKDVKAQYLQSHSITVPIKREKPSEMKSKSKVPFILLGLFSVIGLCSLFLLMTPGIQLFK
jgi:hypothetical protein